MAAGRICRDVGESARAELWFNRGIGLARVHEDRVEYIRGHLGYGLLLMQTRHHARARELFNTASSRAMRDGFEWLAAEAQHDLFRFTTVTGDYQAAEAHARKALQWYPKSNERVLYLAADVAFYLVCLGYSAPAARLLRMFLRKVRSPDRILALSLYVRVLATLGRTRLSARLQLLLQRTVVHRSEYEAAVRWHLAEAARAVQDWETGLREAKLAVELATESRDGEVVAFARETLARCVEQVPHVRRDLDEGSPTAALVKSVAQRLEQWTPTRRGRPRSLERREWRT